MHLHNIQIRQFRNIRRAEFDLGSMVTLMIGANGQGKTNALNAIATLAMQRYPSGLQDHDVVSWELEPWMELLGKWRFSDGRWLTVRYAVDRREKVRRVKEGPKMPVVWFSPSDLRLLQGGPGYRRDFLDQVCSTLYPRYGRTLHLYERAVAQKNRGLKDNWPFPALETFNQILAEHGSVLWELRSMMLKMMIPEVYRVHQRLAEGHEVTMQLKPGGVAGEVPTSPGDMMKRMHARFDEERSRFMCLVGPHRDDLIIHLNGHLATTSASQGQQRTLALSVKLATFHLYHQQLNVRPLVLLDDVLSELDPSRRDHLLEIMADGDQQTVITDTEARWYSALQPVVYRVDNGEIRSWRS